MADLLGKVMEFTVSASFIFSTDRAARKGPLRGIAPVSTIGRRVLDCDLAGMC